MILAYISWIYFGMALIVFVTCAAAGYQTAIQLGETRKDKVLAFANFVFISFLFGAFWPIVMIMMLGNI